MSNPESLSKKSAQVEGEPVAALFSPDLMFLVRLQNMARAAGYVPRSLRSGEALGEADVLVINLAGTKGWESLAAKAAGMSVPVIAFGPHMDAESRRLAKEAGAMRVLANSNLERDLPRILQELRDK